MFVLYDNIGSYTFWKMVATNGAEIAKDGTPHVISPKNVFNVFSIIEIFLFVSNRKFHFCDGKLIRELMSILFFFITKSVQSFSFWTVNFRGKIGNILKIS